MRRPTLQTPGGAWLGLLAALLLAATPFRADAQAPTPTDDLLIDGSDCEFADECQSGLCWRAAGAAASTCQATEMPLSLVLARECPETAELIDSWDRWPGGDFAPQQHVWPTAIRMWSGNGAADAVESTGSVAVRGEMEGRVLAESWSVPVAGVMVTGLDRDSGVFSSVLRLAPADCVVLRGEETPEEMVFAGDDVTRSFGFEEQRIELTGGASGAERVEIAYSLPPEETYGELDLEEAPPPVDDLLDDWSECDFPDECESGYCWHAPDERPVCQPTDGRAGTACLSGADCRSGECREDESGVMTCRGAGGE